MPARKAARGLRVLVVRAPATPRRAGQSAVGGKDDTRSPAQFCTVRSPQTDPPPGLLARASGSCKPVIVVIRGQRAGPGVASRPRRGSSQGEARPRPCHPLSARFSTSYCVECYGLHRCGPGRGACGASSWGQWRRRGCIVPRGDGSGLGRSRSDARWQGYYDSSCEAGEARKSRKGRQGAAGRSQASRCRPAFVASPGLFPRPGYGSGSGRTPGGRRDRRHRRVAPWSIATEHAWVQTQNAGPGWHSRPPRRTVPHASHVINLSLQLSKAAAQRPIESRAHPRAAAASATDQGSLGRLSRAPGAMAGRVPRQDSRRPKWERDDDPEQTGGAGEKGWGEVRRLPARFAAAKQRMRAVRSAPAGSSARNALDCFLVLPMRVALGACVGRRRAIPLKLKGASVQAALGRGAKTPHWNAQVRVRRDRIGAIRAGNDQEGQSPTDALPDCRRALVSGCSRVFGSHWLCGSYLCLSGHSWTARMLPSANLD